MFKKVAISLAVAACSAGASLAQAPAWEPTKTIEIIVPFAPGGASDQMARTLQAAIQKNGLSKQSVVVVNKPAAAGGEAMMEIRNASGDPHKLITTSSALYMIPLSSKLPVNWRDFTPIAMLAQDEFLLWTYTDAPFKTAADFMTAAKTASPPLRIGGNGSKRIVLISDGEDQSDLLARAIESAQEAGTPVSTILVGSGEPAFIPIGRQRDPMRDEDGEIIRTTANPAVLSHLAEATGGHFLSNPFQPQAVAPLAGARSDLRESEEATQRVPSVPSTLASAGATTGGVPPARVRRR